MFFGQIWSQKLMFSELSEIWYMHTMYILISNLMFIFSKFLWFIFLWPNLWQNFVPSCFLQIDEITLWYADYQLNMYFFIYFRSNFLLVHNYINNICLFQKLNIFLSFKEVQIWLTQRPFCEANYANSYVTVRMLWYIKSVYN